MSLKENIQGQNDGRLEDANSSEAIIRVSPSDTNSFIIRGNAVIIDHPEILAPNKVKIPLDSSLMNDAEYGTVIKPYEFMRIYLWDQSATPIETDDWVDIKVTAVYAEGLYTMVEGIVVKGKIEWIHPKSTVRWSFYYQREADNRSPINLYVGSITDKTASFTWEDSTKNNALYHRVQVRQVGAISGDWSRSFVGGWVFGIETILQGARWPAAYSTYSGKNVYWMQFSDPDTKKGKRAEGWIEIINGNFGEAFILNTGSGYKYPPSITLYYEDPSVREISNPSFRYTSGNDYIFIEGVPAFVDGEVVEIDFGKIFGFLNGIYEVYDAVGTGPNPGFKLKVNNTDKLQSGSRTTSGSIKIAPVALPKVPGEIKPIFFKNKYNITGLLSNQEYEISVVSYFNDEHTDFSDYAPSIKFKTR